MTWRVGFSGIHREYTHTHTQIHIATCSCAQKHTRMQRVTHTEKYSSSYRHPWAHIRRKPRAMGMPGEAHTFIQAQRLADSRTQLHHGNPLNHMPSGMKRQKHEHRQAQ